MIPVERKYINNILGLQIEAEEQSKLLLRMGMTSAVVGERLDVTVPFYRNDILQQCDIAEDIAIAFDYNNIAMPVPQSLTFGEEFLLNKLSDMVREETAACGFVECYNFVLCSLDENTKLLNRTDLTNVVKIANSKTPEFQCARTTLLTPILKTL